MTIPNSVTSIGDRAFYGCSDLKSVSIGNSVTSIGDEVFHKCDRLLTVTSMIKKPFHCAEIIPENTYRNGTLYVPVGTKDLYIRFDGWRSFLDIVEIDTEGIKQAKVDDVSIACYGNQLSISGVAKGTAIIVYDSAGRQIGAAKASDGVTIIDSSLKSGDVVIVKIGEKSVKVLLKQ